MRQEQRYSKKLPCNKKEEEEEKKVVNKKSPKYIRKKVSSYVTFRVKRSGLYNTKMRCKYANISEVVKSLESQFDEFMNWGNYGIYWDIDHIIPQCMFDFTILDEVRTCWDPKNVRPLRREENAKKSNEIDIKLIEEYGLLDIYQTVI